MTPDLSSFLGTISVVVSVGVAAGFSVLLLVLPRRPALRAWVASLWLLALAVCMRQLPGGPVGPAPVAVSFAALALCGGALLLVGVSQHVQRPLPFWKPALVLAPLLLAMLLDGLLLHLHGMQRNLSNLCAVAMYAWMTWMLLRRTPPQLRLSYYVAAGVFAAHTAYALYGLGLSLELTAHGNDETLAAVSQRIVAGVVLLIAQSSALMLLIVEEIVCELKQRASVDGLTGLLNRNAVWQAAQAGLDASLMAHAPFAALIMDLDYFKRINDNWGHLVGDEVLRHFADLLRRAAPGPTPVLGRYGGEEFVVVLPGADADAAMEKAQSIVEQVHDARVPTQAGELRYTVSIGVVVSTTCRDLEQLMSRADAALYHAKATGRDSACLAVPCAQTPVQAMAPDAVPQPSRRRQRRSWCVKGA
ncbi:GGDEF domain-containing protein [Stenotrophomonas sp. UBA7606]|uniref:GGDEF domain-containing protein n=1 Tax=Stenotrophomonas sp. UBA7606 TaxID=1947559 RepID=UPI0025FE2BAC|nr:GGDEF domain-containing protein [Stenotrophomonas sp. UBA7606]